MEDYYPDEIILLVKRENQFNKKVYEDTNKKEKVEEVYWSEMGI